MKKLFFIVVTACLLMGACWVLPAAVMAEELAAPILEPIPGSSEIPTEPVPGSGEIPEKPGELVVSVLAADGVVMKLAATNVRLQPVRNSKNKITGYEKLVDLTVVLSNTGKLPVIVDDLTIKPGIEYIPIRPEPKWAVALDVPVDIAKYSDPGAPDFFPPTEAEFFQVSSFKPLPPFSSYWGIILDPHSEVAVARLSGLRLPSSAAKYLVGATIYDSGKLAHASIVIE